jgi:hypothetical protein
MILYKYVSFEAGKAILGRNSIGFSQPKCFNDPFDLPTYPPEPAPNPVESLFSDVRTWVKNHIWAENTGILSLTRTPTNPLMWAHYADKHQGVVVGLDVVGAGLTKTCRCRPQLAHPQGAAEVVGEVRLHHQKQIATAFEAPK